jgi:hypothetical protein
VGESAPSTAADGAGSQKNPLHLRARPTNQNFKTIPPPTKRLKRLGDETVENPGVPV